MQGKCDFPEDCSILFLKKTPWEWSMAIPTEQVLVKRENYFRFRKKKNHFSIVISSNLVFFFLAENGVTIFRIPVETSFSRVIFS